LVTPLGVSEDPTIFSRSVGKRWEAPYVAYRLGFYGKNLIPEFQILFDRESSPTTVRGSKSVSLGFPIHLAGTYDGLHIRLFANGKLIKQVKKVGSAVRSSEPPTVGSRSLSDPGGYYIGLLHEMRAWNVARTQDEINRWKFRVFPLPTPPECQGLWQTERGISRDQAVELVGKGFSHREIAWASFVTRYVSEYNRLAPKILGPHAKSGFSESITSCVLIRAKDGYLAIYEPTIPTYLKTRLTGIEGPQRDGFFVFDESRHTVSQILQSRTRNAVKVAYPPVGSRSEEPWAGPQDIPDATDGMFAPEFRNTELNSPRISISPNVMIQDGRVSGVRSGRIRVVAPLIAGKSGEVSRFFSALFIDLWFGEISWDVAATQLAEGLAISDLITLGQIASLPVPPGAPVSIRPTDPTSAVESVVEEFEKLLDMPGVDEVKDIQPFLSDPKRWFLLSPSCKQVWPQKMLGSKYRVDFVVMEAVDTYLAIEIESPNKKIYKTGKEVDPYSDFTHAEQQVRDYCNYVDWNRDSVEREEGLVGIFRPRGLVVIGRRRDLSPEGARKLKERNADSSRYTAIVYDDLIDQARQMIDRLKVLIG
jgi:Domain of unknown function (DUF4263)/Concanavalin A-like lectin/glucanases superfamily